MLSMKKRVKSQTKSTLLETFLQLDINYSSNINYRMISFQTNRRQQREIN